MPGKVVVVTGGAGYIGSHVTVALCQAGYDVVIVDNFSNSHPEVVDSIRQLISKKDHPAAGNVFVAGIDIARGHASLDALRQVFQHHPVSAVIHMAALKSVPESTRSPLGYYETNVAGLLNVLRVMSEYSVHRLIFSSSATVYGNPAVEKVAETEPLQPTNPYGWSKRMGEQICQDMARHEWSSPAAVISLRYANPVNSHHSGKLPETPRGPAMNLFNVCMEVIKGQRDLVNVFGSDYPTPDGTGVRDYIHVEDVASAHVSALKRILSHSSGPSDDAPSGAPLYEALNVGIGRGHSVLELIRGLENQHHTHIPFQWCGRRPGDVARLVFDVSTAAAALPDWKPRHLTIEDLCRPNK